MKDKQTETETQAAIALQPVVSRFEVQGAGEIELGDNARSRCGTARGVRFEASWSKYGMCGGVMDRAEMVRLRDHLNALLG